MQDFCKDWYRGLQVHSILEIGQFFLWDCPFGIKKFLSDRPELINKVFGQLLHLR